MVNLAKNKLNTKIKTIDIELGIIISKEYYCLRCDKKMCFVKESKKGTLSHFRHLKEKEEEIECEYYSKEKYSIEDINNEIRNKKSEYHNHWQNIFPSENLEYMLYENGKRHYADIYISNETNSIEIKDKNNETIFKNYKVKDLVIEIQHSKISEKALKERTEFYQRNDINRELIWIFDLEKKCKIYKIITFNGIKYRLKLLDPNYHSFMQLYKIEFKKNIIVLLDNGTKYLYIVKDKPIIDKDYIEVEIIDRELMLKEIGEYIGKEIKWGKLQEEDKMIIIDYETPLKSKIYNKYEKNNIRHIFYLMEYIPYYELKGYMLDYFYSYLKKYSNEDKEIMKLFEEYIKDNRPVYKNKITFGEFKSKSIFEIRYEDLKSIYKEYKLKNRKDNELLTNLRNIIYEHYEHYKELNIYEEIIGINYEILTQYYCILYNIYNKKNIMLNTWGNRIESEFSGVNDCESIEIKRDITEIKGIIDYYEYRRYYEDKIYIKLKKYKEKIYKIKEYYKIERLHNIYERIEKICNNILNENKYIIFRKETNKELIEEYYIENKLYIDKKIINLIKLSIIKNIKEKDIKKINYERETIRYVKEIYEENKLKKNKIEMLNEIKNKYIESIIRNNKIIEKLKLKNLTLNEYEIFLQKKEYEKELKENKIKREEYENKKLIEKEIIKKEVMIENYKKSKLNLENYYKKNILKHRLIQNKLYKIEKKIETDKEYYYIKIKKIIIIEIIKHKYEKRRIEYRRNMKNNRENEQNIIKKGKENYIINKDIINNLIKIMINNKNVYIKCQKQIKETIENYELYIILKKNNIMNEMINKYNYIIKKYTFINEKISKLIIKNKKRYDETINEKLKNINYIGNNNNNKRDENKKVNAITKYFVKK